MGRQTRRPGRRWGAETLEGRALLAVAAPSPAVPPIPALKADNPLSDARLHGAILRNVPYENVDGRVERLDVYEPSGTPPAGGWPVLVAIHGGGWHKFSKNEYGPRIAKQFLPHGFAVVAINYELSTPLSSSWPASFEDVTNAVRWIRSDAESLGIDPSKIAAIGESAGGNLAELLGTDPNGPLGPGTAPLDTSGVSAQVGAVVSFYGPSDLVNLVDEHAMGTAAVEEYMGGSPTQVPENYAEASPIDHVSSSAAPMFLVHGTADPIVPFVESKEMVTELSAAGVRNEFVPIPDGEHGLEFTPEGIVLVPRIVAFLDSVLNDAGTSSTTT
jgi:acetyl esterase/lipase